MTSTESPKPLRVPIWQLDREDRFSAYIERSAPWFAAREAAGAEPWHAGDVDRRRALFDRRYQKPAAPTGLFTNLEEIRRAA